jgi:hypothetical protein
MHPNTPYLGDRGPRPRPAVDPDDVLFWNRWQCESVDPETFLHLDTRFLAANAAAGSNGFLDSILAPSSHLYDAPDAKHYLHLDPDMLIHTLTMAGLPAVVYENDAYITVRVAAERLPNEWDGPFITRIMGSLLSYKIEWSLFSRSVADEHTRFSTEEGYQPHFARTSIGITGATVPGGLYFTKFRYRADDYSGRGPGEHPLLNDTLRAAWSSRGLRR